jgi:hypothetical protein
MVSSVDAVREVVVARDPVDRSSADLPRVGKPCMSSRVYTRRGVDFHAVAIAGVGVVMILVPRILFWSCVAYLSWWAFAVLRLVVRLACRRSGFSKSG